MNNKDKYYNNRTLPRRTIDFLIEIMVFIFFIPLALGILLKRKCEYKYFDYIHKGLDWEEEMWKYDREMDEYMKQWTIYKEIHGYVATIVFFGIFMVCAYLIFDLFFNLVGWMGWEYLV